jgi:hypothetical protein
MADKDVLTQEAEKASNKVAAWLAEIDAAKQREKEYRKDGVKIHSIYNGSKEEKIPFNILYSNTETLLPALYSSVPRPVVQRRFKDGDMVGKASAKAGERVLEFLLDTNIEGYETYDECVRAATLDGLLSGRGLSTVKYDAELAKMLGDDDKEGEVADKSEPQEEAYEKKSELVCVETKSWDKVYFGYAKRWSKVPFIVYEEYVDKTEATRLFGEEKAGKLKYNTKDEDEEKETDDNDEKLGQLSKTACVYQIWHKKTKKVIFVSSDYKDGFLKEQDDPLGLTGFFNMPRPMMFLEKSNDLMPVALYTLYENQATELNRLTLRIQKVVEAIKARGIYDSELGDDIAKIMEESDNALVPADKSASLSAEKGLGNAIWFMPIEQLVNVLVQLYGARNQCKQIIYEITGISDIMRGSTNANETLGAQEIKKSFGTLRLKRLQSEVQRYARDLLRMMLEIAASKFSEETWQKMTGLPYLTDEQKQLLDMQAAQIQQTGQQPPPELQEQLQMPTWSAVLEMLNDDVQRSYRIDIESNSTVQPEATEDQKNIAEVMNALAQYMNGIAPLVVNGSLPFEAAQSMMLAISRRFRFGSEIEEHIMKMKQPEKEDPKAAEQAKQQAEAQAKQADMQAQAQMKQAEAQIKAQEKQIDLQAESAKFQSEKQAEMMAQDKDLAAKKEMLQMELESKERIAENVARIQANAQLTAAKISSSASTGAKMTSEDFPDGVPEEMGDEIAENDAEKQTLTQAFAMMAQAIQMLAQPKETVITQRDEQGRAIASVQRIAGETIQ